MKKKSTLIMHAETNAQSRESLIHFKMITNSKSKSRFYVKKKALNKNVI